MNPPASVAPRQPPRAGGAGDPPTIAPGAGGRRLARRLALLAGAVAVLLLVRVPLLVGVARVLDVEDPLARSDLIFLHMGQMDSRPFHAAELYRRGVAPRVVLARTREDSTVLLGVMPTEADATVRLLQRLGVPRGAIVEIDYPGGTTSTREEALALRAYLLRHPARRVTVVTTRYHTRRARWNHRRALAGLPVEIRMSGNDDRGFDATNWWRTESGLILYLEEYLKWVHSLAVER